MKLIFPILLSLLTACGYSPQSPDNTKPASTNSTAIPEAESDTKDWQKLYSESEQETLTFYQEKLDGIDQKQYAALSAVQFVNLLLSETEEGVRRTVLPGNAQALQLESGAEVVIVQEEKIPDDSLAGEIRFFKIRRENDHWDLAAVSAVWKCYPGRGHINYSTLPCL